MRGIRRRTLERRRARRNTRLLAWGLVVAVAYGTIGFLLMRSHASADLQNDLLVAMYAPAAVYAIWWLGVELPRRRAQVALPVTTESPRTLDLIADAFDAPTTEPADLHSTRPQVPSEYGSGFDGRLSRTGGPVPSDLQPAFRRRLTPPDPTDDAPADGAGPAEASGTA